MSTPTHQTKRARTTGATTNNFRVKLQNLFTTQVNAMKNEFDVKLSQVTDIQREQQYQLEILVKKYDELQLLADENKELRRELNQVKEIINEMRNEFKKQLDDLKQKDSTDSRRNSTVATGPTTNNATFTFTQKLEKISTPTPTHQKKRPRTTGNATNSTVATTIATTNNVAIQLQNLTTQMNAMKNEFDVKLSQVTNIQRDQQNKLEILRDENKKLKTEYEAKIKEMKNEFKKQLEDLKKRDSTEDSHSGTSAVTNGNDELSNTELSTVTQEVQSISSTTTNINDDVKNIKVIKELSSHYHCIKDVLIFTSKNNEKMVATASEDGSIIITRINDNKLVKTIAHSPSSANNLVMTKINNNDVIARGGGYRYEMVKFWSIDNHKKVASFECEAGVWSLAAYELNGRYMLACGLFNGWIELWDVQSKKRVDALNHYDELEIFLNGNDWGDLDLELLALHTFKYQNKTYLLSADNKDLKLWYLDDGNNKFVKTLLGGNRVRSLATFDLNNDLLIAACVDEEVMLWKMNNLEPYHQFNLQGNSRVAGLKPFMSNGKVMLATVSYEGRFHVLDVQEKKVVHEFKCEGHWFQSLDAFEEDGNYLFIAGVKNKKTKKGSIVFLK